MGRSGTACVTAYVGLGSNLGDRLERLRQARRLLAELPGCRLLAASHIYETAPVGPLPQPDYLNAALALETGLPARELLGALQAIERRLGRERALRWGPRLIDCDLLLLAQDVICEVGLRVPHPELARRAFVLAPLLDLAPALRHPETGVPLAAYLERVRGQGGRQMIRRMEGVRW